MDIIIVAIIGYLLGGGVGLALEQGWNPASWIGLATCLSIYVIGEVPDFD